MCGKRNEAEGKFGHIGRIVGKWPKFFQLRNRCELHRGNCQRQETASKKNFNHPLGSPVTAAQVTSRTISRGTARRHGVAVTL